MIARVLLVKPPERTPRFDFGTLSLAALAATVRRRVAVSILDATNMDPDEAAAEAWARQPDLLGVTVMGLASIPHAADFVRRLDARRPVPVTGDRALIITGGHGASTIPDPLLRAGADAVVVGEGELTFQDIVAGGLRPDLAGICTLDAAGQLLKGPPRPLIARLDDLPSPARDLIREPADGVYLLETSRGCPHDCAFCETTRFYGRRWRPRSPERVVADIRALVYDHEAMIIMFADDNFTASPRRVRRICDLLGENDVPALFFVSARGDDLIADPELLPAMARARMQRIHVGVESLDPGTAATAGKPITPETYQQAFARMRALGMFSLASMIVGLPGETPEARANAVERLVEAGPDAAQFVPFQATPGVPMAEGRANWEPDAADVADAAAFNAAFYRHPATRRRLEEAAAGNDIRATLASGILRRWGASA
jgi:radical SAM superfamily enzyme YgiQ (UPF0313 family)